MSIGSRIKQARKAQNLSLRDLAKYVGVSAMAISKYERNEATPSSTVLVELGKALHQPPEFFLRVTDVDVNLRAYRKHASLRQKEQDAIQSQIQEWLERYLEVEELFPEEKLSPQLPQYSIETDADIEKAAEQLRDTWRLGLAPIENLTELLEEQGIKVGLIHGFDDFDACTFLVDGKPVIALRANISGDRQRFNLAHELGHLVLKVKGEIGEEKAANRFAGAFLVPAEAARAELGAERTALSPEELYILKKEYGLSMQAWIYRAMNLGIITRASASHLFQRFSQMGWKWKEPGELYPTEEPTRFPRLVFRALAEDVISASRSRELLGKPIERLFAT